MAFHQRMTTVFLILVCSTNVIALGSDNNNITCAASNGITTCDMECPLSCTCSLGSKVLTTVCPNNVIRSRKILIPSDLVSLNVSQVPLHTIDSDAFNELHWWEPIWAYHTLDLSHNMLSNLSPEVFSSLSVLNALDLSYNMLMNLPPDLFGSLNSLASLDLGFKSSQVKLYFINP